jgi:hypothetical protein
MLGSLFETSKQPPKRQGSIIGRIGSVLLDPFNSGQRDERLQKRALMAELAGSSVVFGQRPQSLLAPPPQRQQGILARGDRGIDAAVVIDVSTTSATSAGDRRGFVRLPTMSNLGAPPAIVADEMKATLRCGGGGGLQGVAAGSVSPQFPGRTPLQAQQLSAR